MQRGVHCRTPLNKQTIILYNNSWLDVSVFYNNVVYGEICDI